MKNKFSKVIFATLLLSLLTVNFASAQQPPPTPPVTPSGPSLTKTDLEKAQADREACRAFKTQVFNFTNSKAKAIWDPTVISSDKNGIPIQGQCFIVPASFHDEDEIDGLSGNQPSEYVAFENRLRNGKGEITAKEWADAETKFLKDNNEASGISKWLGYTLNWIASFLNMFVLLLTAIVGSIFTVALDWILKGGSGMPAMVNTGWEIVRDISNMFFILVLIVIGLGSILRLKDYSEYGHLLPELILMAILVNFSKVIAITLIDAVNVLIALFAIDDWKIIWAYLYKYVNLGDLSTNSLPNGISAGLLQGLTKLLFSFVALATFTALTGLLVIRVVVMYILIVLSPLAYVLDILPSTKHFAHEWWEYFLKNLIWVPVALLFVQLSILLAKSNVASGDSAFSIIIIMAFLWGGVIAAEHMGAAGGKMVVNAAEKFAHQYGHMVQGYAGKRWNYATSHMYAKNPDSKIRKAAFAVLNPVASGKAYMQRSHDESHLEQEYALASGREIFSKTKTPYRAFLAQSEEIAGAKQFSNLDTRGRIDAAKNLANKSGHQAAVFRRSLLRDAADNGELEDLAGALGYKNEEGKVTTAKVGEFVRGFSESGHDAESKRFIEQDLNQIGKRAKRFDYTGHSANVADDDGARAAEAEKQQNHQNSQIMKLEEQQKAQLHPANYGAVLQIKEGDESEYVYGGNPGGVQQLTESLRTQMNRMPARFNKIFIPGKMNVAADGKFILEVDREDQVTNLQRFWDDNTDHAKAEIAKSLGAKNPQDQIQNVTTLRVQVVKRDKAGNVISRGSEQIVGNVNDHGHPEEMRYNKAERKIERASAASGNTPSQNTPPSEPRPVGSGSTEDAKANKTQT
jgi:YD repeat-containing protein